MSRRARHDPAPPPPCYCCGDGCDGGLYAPAPAPCYYPPPVPAPCYYPAPVPVPAPAPAPAPAPPSSSTSDHLLHAIVAQLLLGSTAPAPTAAAHAPQPQQQQQPPPPPAAHHAAASPQPHPHHYQYQYQQQEAKSHTYAHPPPPQQQQPQPGASGHGHLLLHSLLRRVAALESALPRSFPPPPPPARRTPHPNPSPRRVARQEFAARDDDEEEEAESPPSPPPRRRPTRAGQSSSARDLAARTIQAHFRRFLARRSRTLRQLKELAVLRSKCAALRASLSGRRGIADPAAVSEAAMGLLFRLDAIQGGDPMIREGKRAVSRELTRILEFVDKVLVKEHEGGALDNDGYNEGCSAGFVSRRPAANRKVSFSGNGRVRELNGEADNAKELDEGYESSSSAESEEVKGNPGKRSANGKPGLATPAPVHMDSGRVAGERR